MLDYDLHFIFKNKKYYILLGGSQIRRKILENPQITKENP